MNNAHSHDAIIVGAGPAGSTAAIRLASAGWSVVLVEQSVFPRRKVCGECIAAGNLDLFDALGIGAQFDALAGPELREVGLFHRKTCVTAPLPPLAKGKHAYGRALGREHLDTLLLERARAMGVDVRQPYKATAVRALRAGYLCQLRSTELSEATTLVAPILIAAHGSWQSGPIGIRRVRKRASDLFAFKGNYRGANLRRGLLPVLAFAGGYGGLVIADEDKMTLACCLRRDVLRQCRDGTHGGNAAGVVRDYLEFSCAGVSHVLQGAIEEDRWLSVGPIRPGIRRPWLGSGAYAIGNVAGEAHPILGEGISMAIQSAWLLSELLTAPGAEAITSANHRDGIGREYTSRWHGAFAPRIRAAAFFAQLAMRPRWSAPLLPLLRHRPALLTLAARLGAKNRPAMIGNEQQPAASGEERLAHRAMKR